MSTPPKDRHTATQIEISLQEEVLDCLDDYCDVYAIDRSMAIGHLLQGALHSALPDPDWFKEDKPLTANASANSRDSASRTSPAGTSKATPMAPRNEALAANPLIQKRHNTQA